MLINKSKIRTIDEVFEEHIAIRARTDELRAHLKLAPDQKLTDDPHAWTASLSEQVLSLHNTLSHHFEAEEKTGIFEDLASQFPHAGHRLDQLRKDHVELLGELRGVIDSVMFSTDGGELEIASLRESIRGFLMRLSKHERTETEFRARLYTEELGNVD